MVYLPTKPIDKNGKKRQISNGKNKGFLCCVGRILNHLELPEKPPWGLLCCVGRILRNIRSFVTKNEKNPGVD